MNQQIAVVGYGLAGVAFAILAIQLFTVWREKAHGSVLPIALLASTAWGLLLAWAGTRADTSQFRIFVVEIGLDIAWLVFLSSLLSGAVAVRSSWIIRRGGAAFAIGLLLVGIAVELLRPDEQTAGVHGELLVLGSIATSLAALIAIEQIFRNTRPSQRRNLKFFGIGLAAVFGFDMLLYSDAVVAGEIGSLLWGVRGYVVAFSVPLIAISVKRVPSWGRGLFFSRQVIFYSTTVIAAAAYLLFVGFAGYYIREIGKDWGATLQVVFLAAAAMLFVVLLLSDQIRARVRVFVAKHFFEQKYDYREEWLRLINTLTSDKDNLPLKKRAIKSLAEIVRSESGHLWLKDDSGRRFRATSSWNVPPGKGEIGVDDILCEFLEARGWVLDLDDLRADPEKYLPQHIEDLHEEIGVMSYVIPLLHDDGLLGFVTLSGATTPVSWDFEDYDLLKTAGKQIAGFLAQEAATEQLAEGRQFEAYNRLTAYVMHDLKNAIAQQSLVVENAQKHKRNPAFVDDAMDTIKGSVERMNRVLRHLKQTMYNQVNEKVDASKAVLRAASECSDRKPVPAVSVPDSPVVVIANSDRLVMAISHAIRNAQDATSEEGDIQVRLDHSESNCEITITDTGAGMDDVFVRERLFRPFDSTKGAEGMGIGAYQIRETARACGGDIELESNPGLGTSITLRLPLHRSALH